MEKHRQKLVEDNMNLVYYVLYQKFPKFLIDEDLVQWGMYGLCRAANTYDETKGEFSTYACQTIHRWACKELRKRNKYKSVPITSLDTEITDNDGDKTTLANFIAGETDIDYVDISKLYNKLSPLDKRIIDLKKQDMDNLEVGKRLNRSHQRIQQRLRRIKRLYDEMYGG